MMGWYGPGDLNVAAACSAEARAAIEFPTPFPELAITRCSELPRRGLAEALPLIARDATARAAEASMKAVRVVFVMVVSCLARKGGMPFGWSGAYAAPAPTDVLAGTKMRIPAFARFARPHRLFVCRQPRGSMHDDRLAQ